MNKLVKYIRRWNIWRKNNLNCKLHKFLVLIGFVKSATFSYILLPEEIEDIWNSTEEVMDNVRDKNKDFIELIKNNTVNKGGTEK